MMDDLYDKLSWNFVRRPTATDIKKYQNENLFIFGEKHLGMFPDLFIFVASELLEFNNNKQIFSKQGSTMNNFITSVLRLMNFNFEEPEAGDIAREKLIHTR